MCLLFELEIVDLRVLLVMLEMLAMLVSWWCLGRGEGLGRASGLCMCNIEGAI